MICENQADHKHIKLDLWQSLCEREEQMNKQHLHCLSGLQTLPRCLLRSEAVI